MEAPSLGKGQRRERLRGKREEEEMVQGRIGVASYRFPVPYR